MRPRLAGLLLLAALLLLAPSSSTRLSAALESAPGGAVPEAAHVATKSAPAAKLPVSTMLAEQHSAATTSPLTPTTPATRSSDTGAARAGADHNTAATDALFFFAFMLLIGIFTVHVLSFTRVPYTALLLVRKREKKRRTKE